MRYISLIYAFFIVSLLCVPVHADPFDTIRQQKNFVPYSEVLEEWGGDKFICHDFDKISYTCAVVLERTTWWFRPAFRLTFLISRARNIRLIAIHQSEWEEDRNGITCGKSAIEEANVVMSTRLWDLPGMAEFARKLEKEMTEKGQYDVVSCDAYFRAGDDFEVRSFDESGNEIPEPSIQRIRFFDKLPQLREFTLVKDVKKDNKILSSP